MSKYTDKVLAKGERVVYTGSISVWSLFAYLFGGLVCMLAALVGPIVTDVLSGQILLGIVFSGISLWVTAAINYWTTEVVITNRRVIAKFEFISRRTIEININKIESVQIDQSIFGRIFDFGSLVIAGAGTPQAPIPGVFDPLSFRRAVVRAQEAAESEKHSGGEK